MMEISSKFRKLCSSSLLLPLLFVLSTCLLILVQVLTNFFILSLNMVEVLLPGVEVVLILPTVVPPITVNKFCYEKNRNPYYFYTILADSS